MGLVPPRILRPRAKPDYTLLEGARAYGPMKQLSRPRGYQPSSPASEQNPPQSVSGAIPWENYLRPEQALQDYEQIIERLKNSTRELRFMDWDMYSVWLKYAEALRQVAFEERDLLSPLEDTAALEWGIRAGIISPDEARIHYRYIEPGPAWGVSMQEAADAFTSAFGVQSNRALLTLMKTIESEISPVRIDGIEPCGYDAL